jgi:hypothetical protein
VQVLEKALGVEREPQDDQNNAD